MRITITDKRDKGGNIKAWKITVNGEAWIAKTASPVDALEITLNNIKERQEQTA